MLDGVAGEIEDSKVVGTGDGVSKTNRPSVVGAGASVVVASVGSACLRCKDISSEGLLIFRLETRIYPVIVVDRL
jgi:hypothetical protein